MSNKFSIWNGQEKEKKDWSFKSEIDVDGDFIVSIVDKKTGEYVARVLFIDKDIGKICTCPRCKDAMKGYDTKNLQFAENGAIKIK